MRHKAFQVVSSRKTVSYPEKPYTSWIERAYSVASGNSGVVMGFLNISWTRTAGLQML
jgi:hypothetical protein